MSSDTPPSARRPGAAAPSEARYYDGSVYPGLKSEPIGEGLRTFARLSGWPVMLAAGNWLGDVGINLTLYNAILLVSLVLVLATQLLFHVHLRCCGVDVLPPMLDIATLFVLSWLSGGIASPLSSAYFLFAIVDTVGLRVRAAVAIAVGYSLSYALVDVAQVGGFRVSDFQAHSIVLHVLYLLWTVVSAGLLAGILRTATRRARAAAQENAILYERSVRTSDDLRSVLNSTENGIFMVDTDRRVRFVSRQMGDLVGTDLSDAVGRYMPVLIRDVLRERFKDPEGFERRLLDLYDHMDEEAVDELEVVGTPPRLLSRYSGPVRDETGRLLGRIEVYSDVTEARAAERLKDEFLSLAAHELKTPITSLKAYAQLLRRKPIEQASPKLLTNALVTIDRQATQLTLLVNDLLDVSRVETGHLYLRLEDVDLSRLVRDLVERMTPEGTGHAVVLEAPEEVWVRADPARVEQVVVNLLTNAIKYSPGGGEVKVSVRRQGDEAVVSVSDRGIGIPKDKLPHIFERFYQAHSTERYSYGGMGLGLYISREIAQRHGGRLWVESEEGRGSTFYFALKAGGREDG